MAKVKGATSGLAEKLTAQMNARYGNGEVDQQIDDQETQENEVNEEINIDSNPKKPGRPAIGKKQKTFYVTNDLIYLLRKHNFEKDMKESTTVCVALEEYFRREGYLQ